MLSVIINPNRYRSKAAEAFCREILPKFAGYANLQPYQPEHTGRLKPAISSSSSRLVVPEID
jgi:hypothetical protein